MWINKPQRIPKKERHNSIDKTHRKGQQGRTNLGNKRQKRVLSQPVQLAVSEETQNKSHSSKRNSKCLALRFGSWKLLSGCL
jgi:hypothetical protein